MKVRRLWMEAQINALSIVSDDVLCSGVDSVASSHELLQSVCMYIT